jgi:hypothetical protein
LLIKRNDSAPHHRRGLIFYLRWDFSPIRFSARDVFREKLGKTNIVRKIASFSVTKITKEAQKDLGLFELSRLSDELSCGREINPNRVSGRTTLQNLAFPVMG